MARIAFFSLGFLVYTAVAAVSVAHRPAGYLSQTGARGNLPGICATAGAVGISRDNDASTL